MPKYTFYATQVIRLENETVIEAATLQEAMAQWAELSQDPKSLPFGTDEYAELPTAVLGVILKDGEHLPGVEAVMQGFQDTGWHGYGGRFDLDDAPEELRSVRELTVVKG